MSSVTPPRTTRRPSPRTSIAGALRRLRVLASGDTRRRLPDQFWKPFAGARALELGGPSDCFAAGSLIALYPLLGSIDGVQPMERSTWHELDASAGNVIEGTRRGELFVGEEPDLGALPDGAYDLVLCSHVIEHIANPLRALAAWRRVSGPGRHLLLVAPHMEGTFDHRRALTPLSHMVDDLQRGTGEDDLTHLHEFLALHDASRNVRGQDDPAFVAELRDNLRTRLLHHHTFSTASLLELLDYARLQVLALEPRLPHDIYVVGSWLAEGERPDNRRFADAGRRSPFRMDRRGTASVSGAGRGADLTRARTP
jgi:SAM-dependent methyltransferase